MHTIAQQSVLKMHNSSLFIQTRVRLQRISDMKFFAGWVEDMAQSHVRIRLKANKAVVNRGDRFCIEIAGKEQSATVMGEATEVAGQMVDLDFLNPLQLSDKKENARISMYGYRGRLLFEGMEFGFTLVDMSDAGMGLLVHTGLEKGMTVNFELYTPMGEVKGSAEVRYCKPDGDAPNQYRSGLLIKDMTRIEKARWNQVLLSASGL